MRKSAKALLAVLSLLILTLSACRRSPPPDASHTPVRMAHLPMVGSLPVAIIQQQKLGEPEVTMTSTPIANANDIVNALVAGQVDLVPQLSMIPVIHLEIQHPGTVRMFAHSRMRDESPFDRLVAKKGSGLKMADLAGKKIGVFPGTTATNLLKAYFPKHGVDASKITFVQLAPPAQLSSLDSGAIDALFAYEPVLTVGLEKGVAEPISGSVFAALVDPMPLGSSVISRKFEREHPEAAKRGIAAVDQALDFMRTHSPEAHAMLPAFLQVPPEYAPKVSFMAMTNSSDVDLAAVQKFIDLLADVGEIPRRIDAHALVAPTQP